MPAKRSAGALFPALDVETILSQGGSELRLAQPEGVAEASDGERNIDRYRPFGVEGAVQRRRDRERAERALDGRVLAMVLDGHVTGARRKPPVGGKQGCPGRQVLRRRFVKVHDQIVDEGGSRGMMAKPSVP